MKSAELRDWQPGDGIRCSCAKSSPIPCGFPEKTRVSVVEVVRRAPRTVARPLCVLHAAGGEFLPGRIVAEAHRIALERLAAEESNLFTAYVNEAVDRLVSEAVNKISAGGEDQ